MLASPPASSAPQTVFFLVRTTRAWLQLTSGQRHEFVDAILRPLLARYQEVQLRYFDAEAYCAQATDVLMWEFREASAYRALVEELRETPFWGEYFEVQDIVPCFEEDFARHYGVPGVRAGSGER